MQGEKSDDGAGEGTRDGVGETERVEESEGDESKWDITRESGIATGCDTKTITGTGDSLKDSTPVLASKSQTCLKEKNHARPAKERTRTDVAPNDAQKKKDGLNMRND